MLMSSTSHAHQAIHLHPVEGWSLLANFGIKTHRSIIYRGALCLMTEPSQSWIFLSLSILMNAGSE